MIPAILGAFKAADLKMKAVALVVVLAVCALFYGWGYLVGQNECHKEQVQAIAAQAHASSQEQFQGAEMAAGVSGETDRHVNELHAKITALERKVASHVPSQHKPCTLDPGVVQLLDEYGRMLNDAPHGLPASNGGAEESEVPRGGVDDPIHQVVPIQIDGEDPVTLTLIELNQYVADLARKYGGMKIKYSGLSKFDDKRLAIERKQFEEVP